MPNAKYPPDHKPGMRVPKGGSSCANCKFLKDDKVSCGSEYFVKWNGSEIIPGKIDEYCSDWYELQTDKTMTKHGFKSTDVELHNDGSATIHHEHHDGPHKDVKHAAADLDAVHDSFEDNLNPEEVSEAQEERLEEKIHPGIHKEVAKEAAKEK